jgi:hypothetical protein
MPQAAARFPRRDQAHAGTRIVVGAGRRPWLGVMAQGHTGPLNAFGWWAEALSMNELSS